MAVLIDPLKMIQRIRRELLCLSLATPQHPEADSGPTPTLCRLHRPLSCSERKKRLNQSANRILDVWSVNTCQQLKLKPKLWKMLLFQQQRALELVSAGSDMVFLVAVANYEAAWCWAAETAGHQEKGEN